jgi:hypothetical protein
VRPCARRETTGSGRALCSLRDWRSRIAVELAFLHDPLVRLVGALDTILAIVTFGREQLRDLVDATRRAAAIGPGRIEHALADLELVIAQVILRAAEKLRGPTLGQAAETLS